MSSETFKTIVGQLVGTDEEPYDNFPNDIEVFCFLDNQQPDNNVGSAMISSDGTFKLQSQISFDDATPITCTISKNSENIVTVVASITNAFLSIAIDDAVYQKLIQINLANYKTIKGSITLGSQYIAAVPQVNRTGGVKWPVVSSVPNLSRDFIKVEVCKALFREVRVLGYANIDEYGSYCVHVPSNTLKGIGTSEDACCETPLARIFVRINVSDKIIEKSVSLEVSEDCTTVNIHIGDAAFYDFFKTEFELLTDHVSAISGLDSTDFLSIITDDEESEELSGIYDLSLFSSFAIRNIIDATKIASQYGIDADHSYLLTKLYGSNINLWVPLSLEELKRNISDGLSNRIIREGAIDNTYKILQQIKIDVLYNQITSDGFTMGQVIEAIIKDKAAAKTFLQLSAEFGSLPADKFWTIVEEHLPEEKEDLQKGVQVLVINGMQPAMTEMMLDRMVGDASVSVLTNYSVDDWRRYIEQFNDDAESLQIPSFITTVSELNGTDPRDDYAQKLFDVTSNIFAITIIQNQLQTDKDFSKLFVEKYIETPSLTGLPTQHLVSEHTVEVAEGSRLIENDKSVEVKNFLTKNPDFDFRFQNIWEIDSPQAKSIRQVVLPLQNMMRLVPSKPQAVIALLKDGLRSSTDIAEISREAFAAKYTERKLLTEDEADNIYANAVRTNLAATNYKIQQQSDNIPLYALGNGSPIFTQNGRYTDTPIKPVTPVIIVNDPIPHSPIKNVPIDNGTDENTPLNGVASIPSLQALFGSMDLCSCSECMSMYSPVAYFTDILNFTKKRLTSTVYEELIRPERREDLAHIDLTCKNSNTVMPYIDLVNEALEIFILKAKGVNFPFKSYQTSGSSKELDAYPEHTYKDGDNYVADELYKKVYKELNQVGFAASLPFNLAMEESRTYFKHLGYSRYDLINKFKPNDSDDINGFPLQLSKIRVLTEWLGLSAEQSNIIFGSYSPDDAQYMNMDATVVGYNQNEDCVIRISYSDGFGRVIMHKAPARPDALTPDKPRWIASGRTIYNNKSNAVMQFESYFSDNHRCDKAEAAVNVGVSPKLHYDALGRNYKVELPDETFTKTIWTAWEQTVYDNNDTIKDSNWYVRRTDQNAIGSLTAIVEEIDAATKAVAHYNTPTVMHTDSLARPFYTIQTDNINAPIHSYVNMDMLGNRLSVVDGLGARASLQYQYNMLKQACKQISIDSGTGHTLTDIAGQPLYAQDAMNNMFKMEYDELRRVTRKWCNTKLLEQIVYGEFQTNAEDLNLRGQLFERYDGSGKQWIPKGYDFKGNPVITEQHLLLDKTLTDADWLQNPELDMEKFATYIVFDALNRPETISDPGNNTTRHTYDKTGALISVRLNDKPYVNDIHYDAKGQRQSIWYANGAKTKYHYDTKTYRLQRLFTVALNSNEPLQDLNYFYDPVGNITTIRDDAQQTLFFNNTVVTPTQTYTYDALYRLLQAKGRELKGTAGFGAVDNWDDVPWKTNQKSDGSAVQNYTQNYTYDAVGNILQLQHIADVGAYTRNYEYESTSNMLLHTFIGTQIYSYDKYDERGNMLIMPHINAMEWNVSNELCRIQRGQTISSYQYSGGQRIRKFVDKGNIKEERIYLGSFEIYRKFEAGSSLNNIVTERTIVHISDDTGRIAMLETRNPNYQSDNSDAMLTRYIYSNHLQSASLELNEEAMIISYEEYHPYGTTSYQAINADTKACAKRYRYTGKERDEESGLYYHGARYYIPWLGRWTACDPINSEWYNIQKGNSGRNRTRHFLELSASPYEYCYANPVRFTDPTGEQVAPEAPVETETAPIKIERNGPSLNRPYQRKAGEAPPDQLDHTGYDPTYDNNGSGANDLAVRELKAIFKSKTYSRPFDLGDAARMNMERAQLGERLPPNVTNAYNKMYAPKPTAQFKPPEKLTTDISKLSPQEKSAVMSRVMSGKGTAQDHIYLGQMVLQGLLKQRFASKDPLVTDLATSLEMQFPGLIKEIEKKKFCYRENYYRL